MKAKYGDIVDYQCPNCSRNMQYTYETMNGHQLMCMHELKYKGLEVIEVKEV